jgi:hypothetical protein
MTLYFANYEKESEMQQQAFKTTVKEHETKILAQNLHKLYNNL